MKGGKGMGLGCDGGVGLVVVLVLGVRVGRLVDGVVLGGFLRLRLRLPVAWEVIEEDLVVLADE